MIPLYQEILEQSPAGTQCAEEDRDEEEKAKDPKNMTQIYENGDNYEGDNTNGVREGRGTCLYADGMYMYRLQP